MKLILSGDFPPEGVSRVLGDLRGILPALDLETSIHRSSDPPSGIEMIGDASEWIAHLGTAASWFLAEHLRRESGKVVPAPAGSGRVSADEMNSPVWVVARSLLDLFRIAGSHEMRMRFGIPLPDRRFGATLLLRDRDEQSVALSIAGFINVVSHLEEFVRRELSGGKKSTGPVDMTPHPDGTVVVRWLDADTMSYHETTLRKRKNGEESGRSE
jgi:hypothetical protein